MPKASSMAPARAATSHSASVGRSLPARRARLLGLSHGPAVREPERGRRIAAVSHEIEPLRIGDEAACDPHRLQIDLVRRALVVEAIAFANMADRMEAARKLGE